MGTVRLGVFPSLNNKQLQDDIAKSVMNWFIEKFPMGFFQHIYLDTQTSTANQYTINTATGELQPYQSGEKILQPNLKITIKQGGNNHDDVWGTKWWNTNQQPGAFAIDTDLTGYKPFIYGPYGIILATNEYTVRNSVEIRVTVQSKADQLAFCNIADSNIKQMYVQIIDADTKIYLPTLLMEYIRSCVFKPEILALDKMLADSEEKKEYRQKINENFSKYLYTGSNGAIKPGKAIENETGITNYMYQLSRKQRITLHLDKYDADDGNKKGGLYDSFNITFSGYIEYANPVSFVTSVPAIIRGTKNNWFIKSSSNTDSKNYYATIKFKEVYRDDRHLVAVDAQAWQHFYFESELLMASNVDEFDMLDDIIDPNDTPTHYFVLKALLELTKEFDNFDQMFKIIIYKNNEPLDRVYYSIDKNFHVVVKNCDLSVPYYIDIWINRRLYAQYSKLMIQRLESLGLNINWDEPNKHFSRGLFEKQDGTHLMRQGVLYSPEDLKLIMDKLSNFEPGSARLQFQMPTLKVGETDRNEVNQFVPIKKNDFLVSDPDYVFYIFNSKFNKYIAVTDDVIKTRPDLDYFIKDPSSDQMLKVDYSKILKPSDKFDYYIYDKSTKKYIYVKDLTDFDPIQQYYVTLTQYDNYNLILKYDKDL